MTGTKSEPKSRKSQDKAEVAEWQTQRIQNRASPDTSAQEQVNFAVSGTASDAKTHADSPLTHPAPVPLVPLGAVDHVAHPGIDLIADRLSLAIDRASEAGQWTVVERLAEQLERHQLRQLEERSSEVTRLCASRKKLGAP